MKMHRLSKSDSRRIASRIAMWLDRELKRPEVTILEAGGAKLYRVDGLIFFERNGELLPIVDEVNEEVLRKLPTVVVDAGASERIARGADVMRPGIREMSGEFKEGEVVVVREERSQRPLAICRAIFSHDVLATLVRGRVLENVHHVGDRLWQLARSLISEYRTSLGLGTSRPRPPR